MSYRQAGNIKHGTVPGFSFTAVLLCRVARYGCAPRSVDQQCSSGPSIMPVCALWREASAL